MLKPSEIIRMAMNHPSYLPEGDDGENWLCGVIWNMWSEDKISEEQAELATDTIEDELGESSFLITFLTRTGVIPQGTKYHSQEYKQAAFEHWNKLIEKLEKEGR